MGVAAISDLAEVIADVLIALYFTDYRITFVFFDGEPPPSVPGRTFT
jgi:Zn-dependent M28 family amino/carboxypeptidase